MGARPLSVEAPVASGCGGDDEEGVREIVARGATDTPSFPRPIRRPQCEGLEPEPIQVVSFPTLDPARLTPLIGEARWDELVDAAVRARELLGGRRVVSVNSTAQGGGVAEMLNALLGYVRHLRIDTEWLAIGGGPEFFTVTKRIHNGLYGGPGDGGELDADARAAYESTLARSAEALRAHVRPGDIVVVHDPQPAGLVPALLDSGALVVWRCHVGVDRPNEWSDRAWSFLRPYVQDAHRLVFSRRGFAPSWADPDRLAVIPPSINPFTPKNDQLAADDVVALLTAAGLVSPDGAGPAAQSIRPATVLQENGPPDPDAPLVVQVSRWDRMKDMPGVLIGFVEGVTRATGAQLVLAGPAVDGVDDDPEALEVWRETVALWHDLPARERARVHLATIPMHDLAANALVVNALQRHASVVVQKSLAEGFGLTVAEAMWKSRPVVASAVGGIADQIVDGESGLLHAPDDLGAFAAHVSALLESPADAARLGANARARVTERFLADRHLLQYAELVEWLLTAPAG
jgi:trehalose synthase